MTKATTKPITLDEYLTRLDMDPYAVPAEIAGHYAAVTDAEAERSYSSEGVSVMERGERLAQKLVLVVLSRVFGIDLGSKYSHGLMFEEQQLAGGVKPDEYAVREESLRLMRDARSGGHAYRLAIHVARLQIAANGLSQAQAAQAQRDHETRISTDPLTGRSGLRVYGETALRSVVPGAHVDLFRDGAWSIKATPLTQFLVGQEVARQILERDPALAKTIRAAAADLIDNNQL